jgi:hypothetical protein
MLFRIYFAFIKQTFIALFFINQVMLCSGPSGRAVQSVGLWPLACWDFGFRILPGAWTFVFCWVLCVLSGRGLCDALNTLPELSYPPWCVVVCDLETLWMRRSWPTGVGGGGCCRAKNKTKKKGHTVWLTLRRVSALAAIFREFHLNC